MSKIFTPHKYNFLLHCVYINNEITIYLLSGFHGRKGHFITITGVLSGKYIKTTHSHNL